MDIVHFTKMNGCGNDFIVIDSRVTLMPGDLAAWSRKVCDRRFGVGADGVLVIEPSETADFALRIFNADGSEAEMCGNGARCAALYAHRHGAPAEMSFTTPAGTIRATADTQTASLSLTQPKGFRPDIRLEALGQELTVHFVDTGVPHAVVFVQDVKSVDVDHLGRAIRQHEEFAPRGSNVDFVEITGRDAIRMRTYERGVEAETLACGTGAVASAVIGQRLKDVAVPVQVHVPGGLLVVNFQGNGDEVKDVQLSGDTQWVFDGVIAT